MKSLRYPESFLLSVVVPVFNEARTILEVVDAVQRTNVPLEIIIVDDGSDDGTTEVLDRLEDCDEVSVLRLPRNRGKGYAVRSGVRRATGNVVVIQDADQEYNPADYEKLLAPLLSGEAEIVYGNRFSGTSGTPHRSLHRGGNRLISSCLSATIGQPLVDVETCYKMTFREHWLKITDQLKEDRFGIEIELTARWSHLGIPILEVPIQYDRRWYDAGKKITWRDGVSAFRCILKYGLLRR